MIQPIIIIKPKDFKSKAAKQSAASEIKYALELLPSKIEQIKAFEIGINILESERACDIVLISEFNSPKDLKIYSENNENQKVVTLIHKHSKNKVSVDY